MFFRRLLVVLPVLSMVAVAMGYLLVSGATNAAPGERVASEPAIEEAQRGEWTRWRGPNGDGISAERGLLKQWPAEGPPLAWQSKGFGSGYSSVAVAGDKVFTLGEKDAHTQLIAASVKDGKILWSTPMGDGGDGPNCTPTVDGDLVFCVSHSGDLACVNAKTGKLVWRRHLKRDLGGRMMSGWGFSESPLVDGDKLICTPGGQDSLLAAIE